MQAQSTLTVSLHSCSIGKLWQHNWRKKSGINWVLRSMVRALQISGPWIQGLGRTGHEEPRTERSGCDCKGRLIVADRFQSKISLVRSYSPTFVQYFIGNNNLSAGWCRQAPWTWQQIWSHWIPNNQVVPPRSAIRVCKNVGYFALLQSSSCVVSILVSVLLIYASSLAVSDPSDVTWHWLITLLLDAGIEVQGAHQLL